jgi:signal transduction histidine kinase
MPQKNYMQRLWDIAGGVSVRVKVLGIVLGVILLLSTFGVFQMRAVLRETLVQQLAEQGVAISENIANHATVLVATDNLAALGSYLQDRQLHYSDESHNTVVSYIFVDDVADNSILAAAGPAAPADLLPTDFHLHLPDETSVAIGEEIVEVITTLPDANIRLHLGLSQTNIHNTVRTVTFQLLVVTMVMVAVGFAAAFFLTWILTRPILDLVAATHAVAQGDFSPRVQRWANDEIGELSTAFNQMSASLEQAAHERAEQEKLRERYVIGVILAQESERQRIARELHDSTSQSLTSLLVGLHNLKQNPDPTALPQQIDELRSVVGQTLEEVRTISWWLRPSALDDLGLVSALQHYIEDYQQRHHIQVDYVARGFDERLPPELETSIYRIVQEGLTNIARYAQADCASVILNRRRDIRIIIEDNGVGFDPSTIRPDNKSLGLQGIRERAALFGGSLTIESKPGQGTSLFIQIPQTSEKRESHHG